MVNKRKRDESNDSDSDQVTPGKQILPVANLPHNFDQEPQDGMQYLFLVRRDARRLPHITRALNPYEVSETKVVHTLTPTGILPCEEWRIAFQTRFSNLRKNLTQATVRVDHNDSGSRLKALPEKKDRDAWWKFLAGHPASAWNPKPWSVRKRPAASRALTHFAETGIHADATSLPEVQSRVQFSRLPIACFVDSPRNVRQLTSLDVLQSAESTNTAPLAVDLSASSEEVQDHTEQLSPPEVTPSHLREIDHRMSIHLLMYFTHWINIRLQDPSNPLATISASHGQWIFALLTKVEDQLSADEMNLLRNLARACLGLIQAHRSKHAKNNPVSEGASSPMPVENTMHMSDTSCWIIFAAIAGYWGQKDLWADAEATLAGA